MLLVIDANVVFSSLISKSICLRIFELNRLFKKFEFIAPEFLLFEISNRIDKVLKFTKFTREEFEEVFSLIEEQIEIIPFEIFKEKIDEAKSLSPHFKDLPYFALALKFNCPVLSGEKRFKNQDKVKVYSPREVLDMMLGKKE